VNGDAAQGEARTPRWVKAFGVATLLALAAFVALHLAGGGLRHHGARSSAGDDGRAADAPAGGR
jgi:hypothetical protein